VKESIMDNKELSVLIESFKAYRDLLTPVQSGLNDFIDTYDSVKENIDKLNTAFGGDVKDNLQSIYKTLSSQAEKASDLSSRIDQFVKMANKYTADVSRLLDMFSKVSERITAVNDLENKAEAQIGRLDALIEEKTKTYNVKELQRTLDSYNTNVQRVGDFINKDVAETLIQSQKKLETIKEDLNGISGKQSGGNAHLEKLLESYANSEALLRKIAEKEDVNEAYIFEILDRWAEERKVKTKKK
jgi:DNA repair ATPase RecN